MDGNAQGVACQYLTVMDTTPQLFAARSKSAAPSEWELGDTHLDCVKQSRFECKTALSVNTRGCSGYATTDVITFVTGYGRLAINSSVPHHHRMALNGVLTKESKWGL